MKKKKKAVLRHFPLDEALEFEALSYIWGEPKFTNRVSLQQSHLCITTSLQDALRGLRFTSQPRTLWVDTLCINQKDNNERNTQVQMMARIYEKAIKVVIWLGIEADGTDQNTLGALEAALKLCRFAKQLGLASLGRLRDYEDEDYYNEREAGRKSAFKKYQLLLEQIVMKIDLIELLDLLQRDWFSRVWIL
jgi:hypothetical protein